MSRQTLSQSPAASQPGMVDSLDSMLDLSGYEDAGYTSPSMSPAGSKTPFARPVNTAVQTAPTSLLSTAQPLTGPSHQYDLYKQQTGIIPGALANTLQVNQNNSQITGYQQFDIDAYFANLNGVEYGFNTSPAQTIGSSDIDIEFESPSGAYFNESTINPNAIGGQEGLPSPPVVSTQSNVGRMWPGMHQQAAMAKAQAQQRQQQQIIAQQQQRASQQAAKQQQRPSKTAQPTDPIVEQKITQLLNSMRARSGGPELDNSPLMNVPRPKKDEDDMDEDERLLASEEGKKLSSKERRQLRNKVSARAFRSRRKEYITQLESEIANKVTENGDLRAQNRALIDENKRLSDLTRMLLSSPSFSGFLENLSTNPSQLPQAAPQVEQQQQAPRQAPKDVNPYAQQHMQRQNVGVAMMPEQTMDFAAFGDFQPQVYAVLETPEAPINIDTAALSGKTSNFVGECFDSEDEKVEMPMIEQPPVVEEKATAPKPIETPAVVIDDDFENDPEFALYHDSPSAATTEPAQSTQIDAEDSSELDIFGGIESEKLLARYELLDASEEEQNAALAMASVQRRLASLEGLCARLDMLTADI
ncbi:hypothetical protein M406DRAFT_356153 [Cryphonectria parasitica EP155]|uniref:BZIP domain-containing protein n=1 Tax=Cryphonectria parasitica (strain ATCC 38755 / EP155) TaxID=660469 RepID=A0A9P5CQ84_CRYP1|nr:uncharacterized protein M406DRAFT_356153 [Cryphonectria parasitica EP155]KAF3765981.1 hypothetical protein M406DRAFT_356153 [Cryphonectria parasitica EP155]